MDAVYVILLFSIMTRLISATRNDDTSKTHILVPITSYGIILIVFAIAAFMENRVILASLAFMFYFRIIFILHKMHSVTENAKEGTT